MVWLFVFVGLVVAGVAWSFRGFNETVDVRGKSVFISGCDTGFGHDLALRLDRLGAKVFAGCLTSKGAVDIRSKASSQLVAIVCDITKQDDIENATKIVESACPEGLWALVNNAGVAHTGEWDWIPEKYLRLVMEVNFFAHVAVTKAFLGQLKKTKGRIVNLTSVAGFATFTNLGPYSCSKHAMEAFSDSLRREMRKWGISVFIIEPAFTATPMVLNAKSMFEKIWNDVDEDKKKEYGEEYAYFVINGPKGEPRSIDPPELVVDVLVSKLTFKYPLLRSRVGKLATIVYLIVAFLPTSWADAALGFLIQRPMPESLKKK